MQVARGAVDGDVEVALPRLAITIPQLGQVLHVHVHEANLVRLEGAVGLARAVSRRQPVQPFGLEDAVDGIPVQVW